MNPPVSPITFKIHRQTRALGMPWLAAPWICVFLPLAFFTLFHEYLVLPRGVRIQLPAVDAPIAVLKAGERFFVVAVDSRELIYFENQQMDLATFQSALLAKASRSNAPKTLLLDLDLQVPYFRIQSISEAARNAGMANIIYHTRRPTP
jgi:biopolymer transport protein ExbD